MVKKKELKIMNNKSVMSSFRWIREIAKRFSRVDRKGRSKATSVLATLGICFGVMTLIVVVSVMNGFQMSFIDSILEISSYHLRVTDLPIEAEEKFLVECENNKKISYVTPFYEAQALVANEDGGEAAVLIRGIDPTLSMQDNGFKKELKMIGGRFDFSNPDSIVIGSSLARKLGVRIGDEINLLVMSGGSDVALFSDDRIFTVTGIFSCGYAEINNAYCFVNLESAVKYFGKESKLNWGVKLNKYTDDLVVQNQITKLLSDYPETVIQTWRDYNKTFFGVLRIEKNMLLMMVALIFVVVGINIYNGMRRLVYERSSEIAILSALGAKKNEVKSIFIIRGLMTGVIGAFSGLLLGLLISLNMDFVFMCASKIMYFFSYIVTAITAPENLMYVAENASYELYANIPPRLYLPEVYLITMFGIIAPLVSSFLASRDVLKMTVSEVLHNE